jgi:NodT family efflux transporter outer membrane factor (OMF) lipoprotein
MKTIRIAIMLTFLAGLASCAAVGPDYSPPSATVPPAWNRLQGASPAAAGEAGNLTQWWANLNDPLLSELIAEAAEASPDLQTVRAALRKARALRSVSGSGLFPTVTASGQASRSQSSREVGSGRTTDHYTAGLDATWEIDLFGGTRRGIEASEADVQSAQASLDDARVSLAAEVALAYVEVRSTQQRLRIARDNLDSQAETHRITAWRAEAGLTGSQEVEQARSSMEQTRAQIPSLEASLAEAEHSLDILLALAPGSLHQRLAAGAPLPTVPERIAVGIPAETLRRRPDVRAAERTLAAETARVGEAEAARYPSLTLSGSIGLEALALGSLGGTGTGTSSLMAGLAAPIFDAGKLKSQVEIQDAVREQAQAAYRKTVLTALQDVENALVSLSRSQERSAALADAVDAAGNAAQLAWQNYTAGLTDFQSVLETQRSLLAIEDSLAGSRADTVTAVVKLYKALGGGWPAQPAAYPEF